jgi:hypothetical protein
MLSGFAFLEELDLADGIEIQCVPGLRVPDLANSERLPNNTGESASHLSRQRSIRLEEPAFELSLVTPAVCSKVSKLHKLHSVFLI